MGLLLFCAICFVVGAVFVVLALLNDASRYGYVPEILRVPLLGSLHLTWLVRRKHILRILRIGADVIGLPATLTFGRDTVVILDDPKSMEQVLNSIIFAKRSRAYDLFGLKPSFSEILAPTRQKFRDALRMSFNDDFIRFSVPKIAEKCRILAENVESGQKSANFDLMKAINTCSLDIVFTCLFGADLNFQQSGDRNLPTIIEKYLEIVNDRVFNYWLHCDWIYGRFRSKDKKLFQDIQMELKDFQGNIFKDQMQEWRAKKSHSPSIIRQMIEHAAKDTELTDKLLQEEIGSLIILSYLKISLTVKHVIFMLAMFSHVECKVVGELQRVIWGPKQADGMGKQKEEEKNFYVHASLPYLTAVIKETMRLFPVIPFITRRASMGIKLGDLDVPMGAQVVLSIFNVHRNSKIWGQRGHSFDPSRFESDNDTKLAPNSFFPFSSAEKHFANEFYWISVKSMLIHLLKDFKYAMPPFMEHLTPKTLIPTDLEPLDESERVQIARRL